MTPILWLITGVFCALIAFVSLAVSCILVSKYASGEFSRAGQEQSASNARVILFVLGVLFLCTAAGTWYIYTHLRAESPQTLRMFSAWYVVGFLSRFILLIKRGDVLSPTYAPEVDALIALPFWALCGPLCTIHLLKELFLERPNNEDPG